MSSRDLTVCILEPRPRRVGIMRVPAHTTHRVMQWPTQMQVGETIYPSSTRNLGLGPQLKELALLLQYNSGELPDLIVFQPPLLHCPAAGGNLGKVKCNIRDFPFGTNLATRPSFWI